MGEGSEELTDEGEEGWREEEEEEEREREVNLQLTLQFYNLKKSQRKLCIRDEAKEELKEEFVHEIITQNE